MCPKLSATTELTIGERIRATYHNLPYDVIPKIMLRYLSRMVAVGSYI
jgi:hypothetical protein